MQSLDPTVAAQVGAWLATYLIHGVALFAAAWLGTRIVRNVRVREQLWRAALFGPLVTASLQLGAGIAPLGGQWDIALQGDLLAATSPAAPELTDGMWAERNTIRVFVDAPFDERGLAEVPLQFAEIVDDEPAIAGTRRGTWALFATFFLAAGIAGLMVRALLEALRVQRLGRGVILTRGPIVRAANAFAKRAGILRRVRVEVTERGISPFATGVLRPRIVVPERAMAELDDSAIRAMVAHEMGHIARLDPLWTAAIRSVSALFFFQPLNWVIARRLDECAEFCCDEFAVGVTGDEIALARCLASVADWIVGPQNARPACAMAHKRSPLGQRVERILATDGEVQTRHIGARLVGPMAIVATALAVPGFAITLQPSLELEAVTPEVFGTLEFPVAFVESTSAGGLVSTSPRTLLLNTLESSVDLLDAELNEIVALAGERDVSTETIQQLGRLLEQAARIRSLIQLVNQYAAAPASPTSSR